MVAFEAALILLAVIFNVVFTSKPLQYDVYLALKDDLRAYHNYMEPPRIVEDQANIWEQLRDSCLGYESQESQDNCFQSLWKIFFWFEAYETSGLLPPVEGVYNKLRAIGGFYPARVKAREVFTQYIVNAVTEDLKRGGYLGNDQFRVEKPWSPDVERRLTNMMGMFLIMEEMKPISRQCDEDKKAALNAPDSPTKLVYDKIKRTMAHSPRKGSSSSPQKGGSSSSPQKTPSSSSPRQKSPPSPQLSSPDKRQVDNGRNSKKSPVARSLSREFDRVHEETEGELTPSKRNFSDADIFWHKQKVLHDIMNSVVDAFDKWAMTTYTEELSNSSMNTPNFWLGKLTDIYDCLLYAVRESNLDNIFNRPVNELKAGLERLKLRIKHRTVTMEAYRVSKVESLLMDLADNIDISAALLDPEGELQSSAIIMSIFNQSPYVILLLMADLKILSVFFYLHVTKQMGALTPKDCLRRAALAIESKCTATLLAATTCFEQSLEVVRRSIQAAEAKSNVGKKQTTRKGGRKKVEKPKGAKGENLRRIRNDRKSKKGRREGLKRVENKDSTSRKAKEDVPKRVVPTKDVPTKDVPTRDVPKRVVSKRDVTKRDVTKRVVSKRVVSKKADSGVSKKKKSKAHVRTDLTLDTVTPTASKKGHSRTPKRATKKTQKGASEI